MGECINQAYAIDGRRQVPAKTASARNRNGFAAIARRAVEALATWQDRTDGRHTLRKLDDRMLRDIGISRADAEHEAGKPFWRG